MKLLHGNGHGTSSVLDQSKTATTRPSAVQPAAAAPESRVTFQTHEGLNLRGTPARTTRHHLIFELLSPPAVPRLSEVLDKFEITLQGRMVYSGRAVVRNVVDAGAKIVCEVTLDEAHWIDLNLALALQSEGRIALEFKSFVNDWQKFYTVAADFKIVVADMQTFLHDLRLWLDRVELGIQALDKNAREKLELKLTGEIAGAVIPPINALFEKFESIAGDIDEAHWPAHARYMRQHLHPLILTAPFANRTFTKPLGYAGDYEMVNMIARNGYEGNSLFAKIIHNWFVTQPPAAAHRNRIKYLAERIEMEAYRADRAGKIVRILDFACGPAIEVQNFFRSAFSEKAEFTLADFNNDTLEYARKALDKIKHLLHLRTPVHFQKKSVTQLFREDQDRAAEKPQYDFVCCAGLFDYLPDLTCRRLMEIFYRFLAPGGLLVTTNVAPSNPLRHGMEHLLDWHLIYRSERELRALCPADAVEDFVSLRTDTTGVDLFIEIRKPAHE